MCLGLYLQRLQGLIMVRFIYVILNILKTTSLKSHGVANMTADRYQACSDQGTNPPKANMRTIFLSRDEKAKKMLGLQYFANMSNHLSKSKKNQTKHSEKKF